MFRQILSELKKHAPYTTFGAITGIIIMLLFYKVPPKISYDVFYILHPIHVFLSALVTASICEIHTENRCKFWVLILIGYLGSVGIGTLSDSIIPYLGEVMLHLPDKGIHLGFIEKWWLVNPMALLGIAVARLRPKTKFPHAGHVLISTWASLFHIIMALGGVMDWKLLIVIFLFLFLAVWIPCCTSDIVFPLLFVKEKS